MNIPANLKYTKDHEWIRVEGDVAYVGITEFAQGELGDVVFVEFKAIGETLDKGEAFCSIEAVKTVSDSYMPVSGEVLEANNLIETAPETINKDSYGNGWLIKIRLTNPSELNDLMTPEQYQGIVH
ncbi:MAG: glycine cleavage system protein H [Bacteroidetes bacterium HGW-Bacteroidetes-21]|jgi:glycine cleavage system H protein|nr:MAG: glycine cleavage system protein H [Bacteroidetes bacterium HGW-Bacteroidetes-21]